MNARSADPKCRTRAVTLAPVPEAVAAGRQWSRETMTDWKLDDVSDIAAQIVSELVTNSIEHARTACVRLVMTHATGTLWIDVGDDDADSLPARRQAGPDDVCGRGLTIIEAMSDRWGISITGYGKSVWCALAAPQAAPWRA
jgi:anti-sigma regulatory factor (Ser/Thr protein kinase)